MYRHYPFFFFFYTHRDVNTQSYRTIYVHFLNNALEIFIHSNIKVPKKPQDNQTLGSAVVFYVAHLHSSLSILIHPVARSPQQQQQRSAPKYSSSYRQRQPEKQRTKYDKNKTARTHYSHHCRYHNFPFPPLPRRLFMVLPFATDALALTPLSYPIRVAITDPLPMQD